MSYVKSVTPNNSDDADADTEDTKPVYTPVEKLLGKMADSVLAPPDPKPSAMNAAMARLSSASVRPTLSQSTRLLDEVQIGGVTYTGVLLHAYGGYRVGVHWTGEIIVEKHDWLSKYSAAMYGGDATRFHEYERRVQDIDTGGHRFVPVVDVDRIEEGESLFHGPTRKRTLEAVTAEIEFELEELARIEAELRERDELYEEYTEDMQPRALRWSEWYTDSLGDWLEAPEGNRVARAFAAIILVIPIPFLVLWGETADQFMTFGIPTLYPRPVPEHNFVVDGISGQQANEVRAGIAQQIANLGMLRWYLTGDSTPWSPEAQEGE